MGLSLMNMLDLSSSIRIALTACYWKFLICTTRKSSVSPGFAKQIMFSLFMLQQLSHLNDRKLDRGKIYASRSQSQNYVTTDGQSGSLSWNKAPIWGSRPDLYYCQMVAGLLMWNALSDDRTGRAFARVTVSSNKSVVSMYNLCYACY
jgi:hypothetical protein